jgi:hypothetical protein
VVLQLEQAGCRGDLAAQGSFLHSGYDDVAAQSQVGRFELEPVVVELRPGRLDRASGSAEHIGKVAHTELRRVKIVVGTPLRQGGWIGYGPHRIFIARGRKTSLYNREVTGALCGIQLMRLA